MSVKIISGPEWHPLQVQEGLSAKRKKQAFLNELEEFNDKVFLTKLQLPVEDSFTLYSFDHYFVHVHDSFHNRFKEKFAPYIEEKQIKYDNLINICIMVKDAGDGFRDILTRNLPYMDRYTILDTGSTDNTIDIIKEVLKDKRGELYEEPFINFRDSRNRLLDLAGDHCHFNIMLDDTYVLNGKVREFLDFARGDDVVSSYSLVLEDLDTMYTSNRVTKPPLKLRYVNLVHEIIQSENNLNVSIPYEWGHIKDKNSDYMTKRTKARKQKDIDVLMGMLEENPDEARTYYYIADSYICMKDWEKALKWFKKRAVMGGYPSEVQDSLYYIAVIKNFYLHHPWEECIEWYIKCYEFNPRRAESLYFIGDHYRKQGMKHTAFMYLKKAYEIGLPEIQMSVRKNIYNFHIPKDLAGLCYELGEYQLGEEAARKALDWQDDKMTENWFSILYHINRGVLGKEKTRISEKKLICFVSPGGWKEWDGETLRTKGLGGSENFTIRYAEYMTKMGYQVAVFCKCKAEKEYEGVTYFPIELFDQFVGTYIVDVCIINRFPEFIPVSCLNGVKTYYVMHDISSTGSIITLSPKLAGTLCISDWHKQQFLSLYPNCESRTEVISYGIETDIYPEVKRQKYNFIYPSFPNRGLLQLLKMWPRIIAKYPEAHLDIFCDIQNEWCQKYWANDMVEIDRMILAYKNTVTNHGWVNGETLRGFWVKAHVWFYPCTFEETCCLTAWEAAASKTLVVSNNLAALKTSIGNRGVIVEGNACEEWWQDQALERMFEVLDNETENEYTDRNFEWVKTKNFETVVGDFVRKYIE
jgi:tetratricopeptide (TPR) repeat protein